MNKKLMFGMVLGLCLACLVGIALSQPGGGGFGGGAGPGARAGARAGGGFGPGMGMGAFGRFNEQAIRQVLGATDQEWSQIQPKLQAVLKLQSEARVALTVAGGRRPGADAGEQPAGPRWVRPSQMAQMTNQELTEGQKAAEALLDLLEKNADIKQIQEKVQALRTVRQKAQQQLATAQAELKKVLSEKQQAMLVLMGLLD